MSDKEPGVMPQEAIGLSEEDRPYVEHTMTAVRDAYRECIAPVRVEEKDIDSRILEFVGRVNELNKERAEFYGRKYSPPAVYFVDAVQAGKRSKEINAKIKTAMKRMGMEPRSKYNDSMGSFQDFGNSVTVFINRFDDKDIDGYEACEVILHEMGHAGGVRKERLFHPEEENRVYGGYRVGAQLQSREKEELIGLAIDEGHHMVEGEVFEGRNPELLNQDVFLRKITGADQMFPAYRVKYEALSRKAGIRNDEQRLTAYKIGSEGKLVGTGPKNGGDYADLMLFIYSRNPELYKLAMDFIYGDKMIAFAKAIDNTFGKGFFERLMYISSHKEARKLLKDLSPQNPGFVKRFFAG
jgi:hypothetical protein